MELSKLKAIIGDVLDTDEKEITEETDFTEDLGADSLDVFQIVMGVEAEFDIEIDSEQIPKLRTVGDALREIKGILQG